MRSEDSPKLPCQLNPDLWFPEGGVPMSLAHPDNLRADAARMRERAAEHRATAKELDRTAASRERIAARNEKLLTERGRL